MKNFINYLFFAFLFVLTVNCNNYNQGNIDEDQEQDIRIRGDEKQAASDNAYPDNATGDYLSYISEDEPASYASPKKSLKLLAAAIVEKNEEANIDSSQELQNLAALDLKEDYSPSKEDFTTILNAFEQSFQSGAYQGSGDSEGLKEDVENLQLEADQNNLGKEMKDFFDSASELLRQMQPKGA